MDEKLPRYEFEKFPLGFWPIYPYDISGVTEEEIKDWAEIGMTLTVSADTDHSLKDETLRVLDLCQKYGIKLILRDDRTWWTNVREGKEEYRKMYREAVEDYGHHPATVGFFLGDEPGEAALPECAEAYRIALSEGPDLIPYLNMYPAFAGKARNFMKDSGCRLLSFDRYTQMNPEESGKDGFYSDLVENKRLADENDVPMLAIMLSAGHYRYRVPSEDDYRWQLGVALACGANAVFWFTYRTPGRNNNYRGAPISEFGDKNPTYYALRNVQKRFNAYYADLFNHCTFKSVYWYGKKCPAMEPYRPLAYKEANEAGLIGVYSEHSTPGLVTFFDGKGKYEGRHYVMVTNNTNDKSDLFYMTVPADVKKMWRVYTNGEIDFASSHHDARLHQTENYTECGCYLAPGQYEIFRFEV